MKIKNNTSSPIRFSIVGKFNILETISINSGINEFDDETFKKIKSHPSFNDFEKINQIKILENQNNSDENNSDENNSDENNSDENNSDENNSDENNSDENNSDETVELSKMNKKQLIQIAEGLQIDAADLTKAELIELIEKNSQ